MKTKESTIIDNHVVCEACPCCKSEAIGRIGKIRYKSNTKYSNSSVTLTQMPELWKCLNCGSWFTQYRVSENDSIRLYSMGDSWASHSFKGSKSRRAVEHLGRITTEGLSLLDVGCSNGAFLDFAKSRGCRTSGLEYSDMNRSQLRARGHDAYRGWEQIDGKFDIISAFDLVEHLYDLDAFFKNCSSRLEEGGVLILLTGSNNSWSAKLAQNNWWYVRFPEHIVFPSHQYLKSLKGFSEVSTIDVYPSKFLQEGRSASEQVAYLVKSIGKSVIDFSLFPIPFLPRDHSLTVLRR